MCVYMFLYVLSHRLVRRPLFRWYLTPHAMSSLCCQKMLACVAPWKAYDKEAPLLQDQSMGSPCPHVVVGQVLGPDQAQALTGIDTLLPWQVYIQCICISWSYV